MKYKIYGTWPDGTDDMAVVYADTIEEIQEQAQEIADVRKWTDCWSDEF